MIREETKRPRSKSGDKNLWCIKTRPPVPVNRPRTGRRAGQGQVTRCPARAEAPVEATERARPSVRGPGPDAETRLAKCKTQTRHRNGADTTAEAAPQRCHFEDQATDADWNPTDGTDRTGRAGTQRSPAGPRHCPGRPGAAPDSGVVWHSGRRGALCSFKHPGGSIQPRASAQRREPTDEKAAPWTGGCWRTQRGRQTSVKTAAREVSPEPPRRMSQLTSETREVPYQASSVLPKWAGQPQRMCGHTTNLHPEKVKRSPPPRPRHTG